jgi:dihydroorotate dehydrogenase (fumarate)
MSSLGTHYMGIPLANPVIAGASDLTANVDSIRRIEEAGAGAVVLKSLFEEQIQAESFLLEEDLQTGESISPEMSHLYPKVQHGGPKEHLMWVKKSKAAVKIPVIASLNAVNKATWVEYARALADQGVDGLELNFFATPRDFDTDGARVEAEQLSALTEVRKAVRIPLAVKLSVFYSNPLHFLRSLDEAGINAFVLFNRFFQPDVDPESESIVMPMNYSTAADSRLPLRFAGLLYGKVKADVCASTGVATAADAAKMILAGAAAVQVVTALYRSGVKAITQIRDGLSAWMDKKSYATIDAFRGKLSAKNAKDPWAYTRAQYAKMLLGRKDWAEARKG